jgi:hypothetical protein
MSKINSANGFNILKSSRPDIARAYQLNQISENQDLVFEITYMQNGDTYEIYIDGEIEFIR